VLLHHPTGLDADTESLWSTAACAGLHGAGRRPLVLAPNADPGTESVRAAIEQACKAHGWATTPHLPREVFLGLLKRLAATGGVLVGNSSAGLLEAGAVGVPVVNLGPRQSGRERWHGVTDVEDAEPEVTLTERVSGAIHASATSGPLEPTDRFGDGRASERIAEVLASTDLGDPSLLRKRNRF
jgi:UDP-N-acetylglucosamine 2-epimerase